jgi:hypothetical protein
MLSTPRRRGRAQHGLVHTERSKRERRDSLGLAPGGAERDRVRAMARQRMRGARRAGHGDAGGKPDPAAEADYAGAHRLFTAEQMGHAAEVEPQAISVGYPGARRPAAGGEQPQRTQQAASASGAASRMSSPGTSIRALVIAIPAPSPSARAEGQAAATSIRGPARWTRISGAASGRPPPLGPSIRRSRSVGEVRQVERGDPRHPIPPKSR